MPIRIPERVIPGFISLSKLSPEQITSLSDFLKNMEIGIKIDDIDSFLLKDINISESKNVVEVLLSFTELLEPPTVDLKKTAESLFEAFKITIDKRSQYSLSDEELKVLEIVLHEIFKNSERLKLTLKALKLASEDESLFIESRIISDIRIVFRDDISEKKRNALIVHRLHIAYNNDNKRKEFFLAMDISDLKKLKDDIERAIKKDDLIKEDYKENILFIQTS